MTITIIGLAGKARSGKDTTASALVTCLDFKRIALADALREQFAGMDGPTWELSKDLDTHGMSRRQALQLFGTECREAIDRQGLWVDVLLAKVHYLTRYHPVPRTRFVVPDVRYPHEVERLREATRGWGGRFALWRVERPDVERIAEAGHSSEQFVDTMLADRIIVNDGTKEDLRLKVVREANGMAEPRLFREPETEEELFDAIACSTRPESYDVAEASGRLS